MAKARYLTKSRYKMALECPTKLFYTGKAKEYVDNSLDDPFLTALARGGFQVGALAQYYYPNGIEIKETDHDKAIEETNAYLQQENVILFEAAIRYKNLFVRIDILKKVGNYIEIIEVKSKSYDSSDKKHSFYDNRTKNSKRLKSEFAPYLYDIAFQTYVCKKAHPGFSFSPYLFLPDKSVETTVEGLNQVFLLKNDSNGRPYVEKKKEKISQEDLEDLLYSVNVSEEVALIHEGKNAERSEADRCKGLYFEDEIHFLASKYEADEPITPSPGSHCKTCEFRGETPPGLKSGFDECWQKHIKLTKEQLRKPFVFDIWKLSTAKAKDFINEKKYFAADLTQDDILPNKKKNAPEPSSGGLLVNDRQWLQVESIQSGNTQPFIDSEGLAGQFKTWMFPLHFIDFETTTVAIPFNKGRHPYEVVAFQFSHHMVHEDGRIEHANQYLNVERGKFPNFDFVRTLKAVLEKDSGTIFRYANHENTVLCQIHSQLENSQETDRKELQAWIETITTTKSDSKTSDSKTKRIGPRAMVDMCELVKNYYYHPLTKGSNSIKKVLPAILNDSVFIQSKYSKPIYGAENGIKSLNFKDWKWIKKAIDGSVEDPYAQLPPIYKDFSRNNIDSLFSESELADGGAAMMAYSMMQFTQMSAQEHEELSRALLRYCELDTLAMVMLYEYWAHEIGFPPARKAA